jgi:hypothetical protein
MSSSLLEIALEAMIQDPYTMIRVFGVFARNATPQQAVKLMQLVNTRLPACLNNDDVVVVTHGTFGPYRVLASAMHEHSRELIRTAMLFSYPRYYGQPVVLRDRTSHEDFRECIHETIHASVLAERLILTLMAEFGLEDADPETDTDVYSKGRFQNVVDLIDVLGHVSDLCLLLHMDMCVRGLCEPVHYGSDSDVEGFDGELLQTACSFDDLMTWYTTPLRETVTMADCRPFDYSPKKKRRKLSKASRRELIIEKFQRVRNAIFAYDGAIEELKEFEPADDKTSGSDKYESCFGVELRKPPRVIVSFDDSEIFEDAFSLEELLPMLKM